MLLVLGKDPLKIVVVAIAPGGYIYQETCAQVTHYRNASIWRDFVPRIDKKGIARSKKTIVDVISDPNTDLHDHAFISLTYRESLTERVTEFLK